MKKVWLGLALLLFVSAICFAAGTAPAAAPVKDQAVERSQTTATQPQQITPAQKDKAILVLTPAEADSLRAQQDTLLAQSGVKDISVGAISTVDLIYILVVVVLAIVIIRLL